MLANIVATYIRKIKCRLPILHVPMESKTPGPLPRHLQVLLFLGYRGITLYIHSNEYILTNFSLYRAHPFTQQILMDFYCVSDNVVGLQIYQ